MISTAPPTTLAGGRNEDLSVASSGESAGSSGAAPRARLAWGVAALVVCALVVAAHGRFAAVDGRPPVDLNRCYQAVPELYSLLEGPSDLPTAIARAARLGTGAYDLVLAGTMRLAGRSVHVMHGFNLLWVATVLGCGWLTARRLFGAPAGLGAVVVLANAAGVVVMGRVGWIHVPELALLSVVLAALVHDPGLTRWRTAAVVALAGACAATVRPSAVIWLSTLAPLILWSIRGAPSLARQGLRLGLVGALWSLGLIPTALELPTYLDRKVSMRDRYADIADSPALYHQLTGTLCLPVGWLSIAVGGLALAGVVVALVRARRGRLRFVLLLGAWLTVPLAMQLYFVTGPEDFPVLVLAAAVLGAGGLTRLHRLAVIVPLVLWIPVYAAQWIQAPAPTAEAAEAPRGGPFADKANPVDHYRPFRALHFRQILEHVDLACGQDRRKRCKVETYHGLFHPVGEATGEFGLFLTGRENVEIVPLWSHMAAGHRRPPPDGYARYTCADLEPHWDERFPGLAEREATRLRDAPLQTRWDLLLPGGCRFTWMTPFGR
jgi:hypothetical protein